MAFTRKKLGSFNTNIATNMIIEPTEMECLNSLESTTPVTVKKLYNIFAEACKDIQVEVSRINTEKSLSKYELSLIEKGYTPEQIAEEMEFTRHNFK